MSTDIDNDTTGRAAGWYGTTTPTTSRKLGGDASGPKKPVEGSAATFYGKTTPNEKGGKVGGGGEGGWYASSTPPAADPTLAARARAKHHARRG